jgi:hypothetical protein
MAIQLVGYVSGTAQNGTDVTLDLTALTGGIASAAADKDVVVVIGGFGGNTPGADPDISTAGYTELNTIGNFTAHWKRMTSSPDTQVVGVGDGEGKTGVGYIATVWRGVDISTAIDATTTSSTGSNSSPNSPSITTVTNGAIVLSVFGSSGNDLVDGTPVSYPFATYINTNDTDDAAFGIAAYEKLSGAGPEDPGAWSLTGSASWAAFTIALRPAVTQTLTPSLYTDTDTFHTPTINQTIYAALYTDADTFHTMVIGTNDKFLAPELFVDDDTFYAPTATPGPVSMSPALYAETETFYSPVIVRLLSPDHFESGTTAFYTHELTIKWRSQTSDASSWTRQVVTWDGS